MLICNSYFFLVIEQFKWNIEQFIIRCEIYRLVSFNLRQDRRNHRMIKTMPQSLQLFGLFYGRLSLGNPLHNPNKVSCICLNFHASWNGYSAQTAAA